MKDLNKGASSKGGYREPARMVNAVHRTNTAHHPDPYDKNPCKQDISVYYGDLVYGGVSFAIIADRQWKSGPEHVETGSGRADHVRDPDVDTSVLDKPGLILLDFVMPKMNGYQVCRELSQDKELKDIPLVLMSAKGITLDSVVEVLKNRHQLPD